MICIDELKGCIPTQRSLPSLNTDKAALPSDQFMAKVRNRIPLNKPVELRYNLIGEFNFGKRVII